MTKPEYPPGIVKMGDYIGRRVKLVREIHTQAGSVYYEGQAFYVSGHHRGRLTLKLGNKIVLRQVNRRDVKLNE